MRVLIVTLAAVAAVGFGVVAALRAIFGGLFEGLDTNKLADIATLGVVFTIGIVLLVRSGDLAGALIWRGRTQSRRDDGPVIDTSWRELPEYRQPVAQLPAPQRIRVPVYSAMGQAKPVGVQPATSSDTVLESVTHDAEGRTVKLEVGYRYLLRFASLKTPARSEWTGKPSLFYECQRFFDAHGFLRPEGQTKVWRDEYPVESRKAWLYQFEQGALEYSPTPADEETAN